MEKIETLIQKRNEVLKKVETLEKNKTVRDYFKLCAKVERLKAKILRTYDIQERKSLIKQKEETFGKVKLLKRNKAVRDYYISKIKLQEMNDEIIRMHKDLTIQKYNRCNHIFIGNGENSYCLNCGLDTRVLDIEERNLDPDSRIMADYLWENDVDTSDEIIYDLELAKAVYKKIKEKHPEVDDILVRKYLENALNDMQNIKVNEERQKNRAKRLYLIPSFNNWK